MNGTVGTKTKFLGLSVKAQNNGTSMINNFILHALVSYNNIVSRAVV